MTAITRDNLCEMVEDFLNAIMRPETGFRYVLIVADDESTFGIASNIVEPEPALKLLQDGVRSVEKAVEIDHAER